MNERINIPNFTVREADWTTEGNLLSNIRRLVFIVEQNVPEEEELDGRDEDSWHWIALYNDDVAIGTGRLLSDGQIGRMAVLDKFRGEGVGAALLEQAVDKARHLGFTEVFLNAQTHALNFYERAGFIAVGNEFDEAGIPHQKMIRQFEPLDDNVKRVEATEASAFLSVKNFDLREVNFADHSKIIKEIRRLVFVVELTLPPSLTMDDLDDEAIQWIAEDKSGHMIGTIRMSDRGEISRLAVVSEHRQEGVGHSLVELAITKAIRLGLAEVKLDALTVLDNFYTKMGFKKQGDPFDGHGIAHQHYTKSIAFDELRKNVQRPAVIGSHFSDSEATYKLGKDKNLIMLRREEDFRNIILEMASQATGSLRIFSPVLEHKLFNSLDLREICSALARKNKYTKIEILLYDSHRIIKNNHVMLDLSRKLSSSIKMKIVHPDYRRLNHEYVLADGAGVVYRLDHEEFDGYANFADVTDCSRLSRQFTAAWESGLIDPNLRQIRI